MAGKLRIYADGRRGVRGRKVRAQRSRSLCDIPSWRTFLYDFDNICRRLHIRRVTWTVALRDDFLPEYDELPQEVQDELLAKLGLLE